MAGRRRGLGRRGAAHRRRFLGALVPGGALSDHTRAGRLGRHRRGDRPLRLPVRRPGSGASRRSGRVRGGRRRRALGYRRKPAPARALVAAGRRTSSSSMRPPWAADSPRPSSTCQCACRCVPTANGSTRTRTADPGRPVVTPAPDSGDPALLGKELCTQHRFIASGSLRPRGDTFGATPQSRPDSIT